MFNALIHTKNGFDFAFYRDPSVYAVKAILKFLLAPFHMSKVYKNVHPPFEKKNLPPSQNTLKICYPNQ